MIERVYLENTFAGVRPLVEQVVVHPLSALARWKIFDNLRRSLSPIATLLALVLGICLSGKTFATQESRFFLLTSIRHRAAVMAVRDR